MIDTDAGLNLLKESMFEPSTPVNKFKTVRLTIINEHPVHTLGQIEVEILGFPTIFNIIPSVRLEDYKELDQQSFNLEEKNK